MIIPTAVKGGAILALIFRNLGNTERIREAMQQGTLYIFNFPNKILSQKNLCNRLTAHIFATNQ